MLKNCFVWIDLEMTGLIPETDSILEIATIITDEQLAIVAEGPSLVIHQPQKVLDHMNEWVTTTHAASGLTREVQQSKIDLVQAELMTLNFIKQYALPGEGILCGNSVYQDRAFLRRYMPLIHDYLHYRIVDVSSVKELVRKWYPESKYADFKKPENHRALEDIRYSIAELEHYRNYFFVKEA
ncbi:MAG: oligoribonuclease [Candidatus Dependentiae bacterium]|nr:oligoribonuclease [Candidatus Dependentiae bacterium]